MGRSDSWHLLGWCWLHKWWVKKASASEGKLTSKCRLILCSLASISLNSSMCVSPRSSADWLACRSSQQSWVGSSWTIFLIAECKYSNSISKFSNNKFGLIGRSRARQHAEFSKIQLNFIETNDKPASQPKI